MPYLIEYFHGKMLNGNWLKAFASWNSKLLVNLSASVSKLETLTYCVCEEMSEKIIVNEKSKCIENRTFWFRIGIGIVCAEI